MFAEIPSEPLATVSPAGKKRYSVQTEEVSVIGMRLFATCDGDCRDLYLVARHIPYLHRYSLSSFETVPLGIVAIS